ncbi:NAD(P)H-binding protein [Porphyrobacter sp. YT40]|uniref:NAD(P)H-binding protein n=1 Tax=Porphyrobacter sp. YT40 TaxID=2547601 RepID=UPI0011443B96|nr:NAD(P)H-binding protein [Porphyrobacter sp. YT40]QDH33934.1 NAD-dependent epimerase/dehydratase family protein [Porphyrobacter sp. YT40]
MKQGLARPVRVALAGASGTIGQAVEMQLAAEGHAVTALSRAQLADPQALAAALGEARAEVVISCIASRSGAPKDAEAVDYRTNAALLAAAQGAGVRQFILLSAICVQKPRLAFQRAKLRFEAELAASGIGYTIVRPTAFFKSLSGQVARVKAGKPFLIFGDGNLTRCKPISDGDLARFITGCIDNPEALGRILPIGGPGPTISLRDAGELLFSAAGKPPRFTSISPGMFTHAARVLGMGAGFSGWLAEKAEYARIAHYYATESMLVIDPATGEYSADLTPEFGTETLADHYRHLLAAD